MGAPALLQHLRDAGLVLTLMTGGGLHVAPRSALTDQHRNAIRAERDALVSTLMSEGLAALRSRNPLMTPQQFDDCHRGGWDDVEIEDFSAREALFAAMGRTDAQALAERLTLRDREWDDRRMCIECLSLDGRGRCSAAARGRIAGADRRLEPVPVMLQRCEAFAPRPIESMT